jgi:hypothetical protein
MATLMSPDVFVNPKKVAIFLLFRHPDKDLTDQTRDLATFVEFPNISWQVEEYGLEAEHETDPLVIFVVSDFRAT